MAEPAPGTIAARIEAAAAAVGIDDIPTLAAQAGVDPDRIASWDEGKKPTNRDARAVAEALGVTSRWLLFAEGDGPAPDPADEARTRPGHCARDRLNGAERAPDAPWRRGLYLGAAGPTAGA